MTRPAWCAALLLTLALLAPPARAEEPEPATETAAREDDAGKTKRRGKTKFYDFDELLVGGELRSPDAYFASARERMRWSRLLRLRKSFLGALLSTARHPALRSSGGD